MKLPIVMGMMGLGFLLLMLSYVWVALFPATSSWTKEKAERRLEVTNRLHNLAFVVNAPPGQAKMHGGTDLAKAKEEYEQLQKENEQLTAEQTHAINSPRTAATVMWWSGLSLAAVGLVGWYVVKNTS